jgi:hypothetical protein
MSEHTYSMIDIGDGEIVTQCNDCGSHVINKPESEVKHCKTCIPGDAERWKEHYSQEDDDMSQLDDDLDDLDMFLDVESDSLKLLSPPPPPKKEEDPLRYNF